MLGNEKTEESETYLTPDELVARYKRTISVRTLANWRSKGEGPSYTKIGGKILYGSIEVSAWERRRRMRTTLAIGSGIAAAFVIDCLGIIDWFPGCLCLVANAQEIVHHLVK